MAGMYFKDRDIVLKYELSDYDVWMEFEDSSDCLGFYEWWEAVCYTYFCCILCNFLHN